MRMLSFKDYLKVLLRLSKVTNELHDIDKMKGTITSGMIKSLGFLLRNKLSKKIKQGKSSKDLGQKLDSMLDAHGILGSIGIMNIAMEDKGSSLMSRSIIIRGLINELYEEGTITSKEKDLFND